MFTIDKETNQMTIVMKDTASFDIAFDNYYLVTGDKVTFTVAKEKESQDPLIQKELTEFAGGRALHTNGREYFKYINDSPRNITYQHIF